MTAAGNGALLSSDARIWLRELTGGCVRFDEPMSRHTSFHVGGPAEAFAAVKTAEELSALSTGLIARKIPYWLLGGGTNLIVTDAGISGVVICTKPDFSGIVLEDAGASRIRATVLAGTSLRLFCSHAARNGWGGMNFALGIPGTVGGAIRMNAGTAMGWMSDVLEAVTVMHPDGRMETIEKGRLNFSYRKLTLPEPADCASSGCQIIIVSGRFLLDRSDAAVLRREAGEILKNRKLRQPTTLPSAGCIFKNPVSGRSAGELIDLCGLKGMKMGGAEISEKHANFIVNTGSATAADILALMDVVRRTVRERFRIQLEPEVIVVGN